MPKDAPTATELEEKAKTVDFYDHLTDAERDEEGLPPRSQPAGDPEPAAPAAEPPPGETEPPPGDEEEEEEEEEPAEDATGILFEQIAGLRDDLAEKMGVPASKPTSRRDELLDAALEHDDPIIRGLAEELRDTQKQLAETQALAREDAIQRQIKEDAAEFADVRANTLIDGAPMTAAQLRKVELYLYRNKEVARVLSIEEATRRVFPSATRAGHRTSPGGRPASQPGRAAGGDAPAATIVHGGSSGGAPAGQFKPRPNETIESAVAEAGRRLFGVNR